MILGLFFVIITTMDDFQIKIFIYIIIILSAVFHEYAHAWAAYSLGDPTAKNEGRLTLNPVAHMDPFGTVFLPLLLLFTGGFFIGYAKPVPYNPYNLKDQIYGSAKIALAGPASNFFIAIIFAMVLRFGEVDFIYRDLLSLVVLVNIFLGLFNLIPIPPLDGSKLLQVFFPNNPLAGGGVANIFLALMIAFFLISPLAYSLFRILVGN